VDYGTVTTEDSEPCNIARCPHDTRIPKRHLITNTLSGEQYTDVYDPNLNGLQQLCIDAGLSDRLTYCDIECLLTDGETWYMLDECGNWAYLPSVYKVEEVG
jgi:hypothetical protein